MSRLPGWNDDEMPADWSAEDRTQMSALFDEMHSTYSAVDSDAIGKWVLDEIMKAPGINNTYAGAAIAEVAVEAAREPYQGHRTILWDTFREFCDGIFTYDEWRLGGTPEAPHVVFRLAERVVAESKDPEQVLSMVCSACHAEMDHWFFVNSRRLNSERRT
tara:strand:- start:628 stop:1110 length:483 start_codon:yes stop_codon:yes gene_type:complete